MTETQTSPSRMGATASKREHPPALGSVFGNILCAVDGTRTSTAAVKMAATLAGPNGHLTLLVVTAEAGSGAYRTAAISPLRARRVLSNAKRIASAAGVPSTTVIDPRTHPVEVILERASDHDLFAIGAPATSWLTEMLVGGVASVALREFVTPMLVVRQPLNGSLRDRQILAASDGGEGSGGVVELAGRIAHSQGAQVILVNALGPESKSNPRAIQAQVRALDKLLPSASDAYIEPGKASDVILDAAEKTHSRLVVIGSRRLNGLRILGSVSRRVVHDAPCSVLVVPPVR
jgi:nucleotide-binding universal stress UspA family protein